VSGTPETDAIIAAADECPETRVVFLIKNLVHLARRLERERNDLKDHRSGAADVKPQCR